MTNSPSARKPRWAPSLRLRIALAVWASTVLATWLCAHFALATLAQSDAEHWGADKLRTFDGQASALKSTLGDPAASVGAAVQRATPNGSNSVWVITPARLGPDASTNPLIPAWTTDFAFDPSICPVHASDIRNGLVGINKGYVWMMDLPCQGTNESEGDQMLLSGMLRADGKYEVVGTQIYSTAKSLAYFRLQEQMWSVGLAVSSLAALGSWLLAGVLTRPLDRAGEVADRIGSGDLAARVDIGGGDEVARLGQRLNTMANQVQTTLDAQRAFVSDTAHELRTPVSALLATATSLENPATRDEAAAQVAPQLRRLGGLTEDLLTLSRFDAHREAIVREPTDITAVVTGVISLLDVHDQVSVRSTGDVIADVEPARVGLIVRNLISNALQHGAAPVTVTIEALAERVQTPDPLRLAPLAQGTNRTPITLVERAETPDPLRLAPLAQGTNRTPITLVERADGTPAPVVERAAGETKPSGVCIVVDDAGPGVPRPLREHIFERFVRGDESRTTATGNSGLGLAVARENARLHGGDLTLGRNGHGFTVILPNAAPTEPTLKPTRAARRDQDLPWLLFCLATVLVLVAAIAPPYYDWLTGGRLDDWPTSWLIRGFADFISMVLPALLIAMCLSWLAHRITRSARPLTRALAVPIALGLEIVVLQVEFRQALLAVTLLVAMTFWWLTIWPRRLWPQRLWIRRRRPPTSP